MAAEHTCWPTPYQLYYHTGYYLITDRMERSFWSADLNHGFGQELSSEQLQHGVHYVLPAFSQYVAMPMGEVKYCLGGCLCLTVAAKHCRKVFNRLQGQWIHQHSQLLYSHYITNISGQQQTACVFAKLTLFILFFKSWSLCIPFILASDEL